MFCASFSVSVDLARIIFFTLRDDTAYGHGALPGGLLGKMRFRKRDDKWAIIVPRYARLSYELVRVTDMSKKSKDRLRDPPL